MQKDLGLNEQQMGNIFSALGLPEGFRRGWMGPRKFLIRIVIRWSFSTAVTGLMWHFVSK